MSSVSRWRKSNDTRKAVATLKELLGVDYTNDLVMNAESIIKERKNLLEENKHLKSSLESLRSEFNKKRVHKHAYITIRNRKKTTNYNDGVIYFPNYMVGTKVVVWRKD